MVMTLLCRGLCLLTLLIPAACSGGTDTSASVLRSPAGWVATANQTGGGSADAMAAAVLLAAARAEPHGATAVASQVSPNADRLVFQALSHLEVQGLASGVGPLLEGGELIRRLARDPAAPVDQNGNGSNLDETLAAELTRLEGFFGGARDLAGVKATLFPWSRGTANLASPLASAARREDASSWRMADPKVRTVDLAQVGHALFARSIAVHGLLGETRGSAVAMTADGARLGLGLLLQSLAADETVLRSLFFDGTVLGDVGDPATYDPHTTPRWLPTQVKVLSEPARPEVPTGYVAVDAASELLTTAIVLRAASELAWVADRNNPLAGLRQVFGGTPFGRGSGIGGGGNEVTFSGDVSPLLNAKCLSCHSDAFPTAGFSVETYKGVVIEPYVVRGDHKSSGLWLLLNGPWQKPGARRPVSAMPPGAGSGGPFDPQLDPAQRQMIADWIDGGALKEPTGKVPPPKAGLDLATVLARNLYGLHQVSGIKGALEHRIEGFTTSSSALERSGYVDALATGHALTALSAYLDVMPSDTEARDFLVSAAAWAGDNLTTVEGEVFAGFDLARGVPVLATAGSLESYAAMVVGLVAAQRVVGGTGLRSRAIAVGKSMIARFYRSGEKLFDTSEGSSSRKYTPRQVATLLESLNHLSHFAETADLATVQQDFLGRMWPQMVFSEFEGLGEVLGDGVADSDKNGVPEPGLAGGENGLAPVFVGSLRYGEQTTQADEAVSWTKHIAPLFRQTCVGCHVGGASLGNYRVDTPGLTGLPGDSGRTDMIVPGDPEASFLYRKLVDRTPAVGGQMPLQKPPLNARGKELVRRWILEGAKNR